MKLTIKWLAFYLAAVGVALLITYHPHDTLEAASQAPLSTTVQSLDGTKWELSRFAGKPVFVNFWATWCPPCQQELPVITTLSQEFAGRVNFVGIAVDSPAVDIKRIVDQQHLAYQIATAGFETLEAWHAHTLPTSYLVSNGKIVWSHVGAVNEAELRQAFIEALKT